MKILVIGGMHGNEMLGIKLVNRLQKNPIIDVDTLLANERAVENNSRFIDQDLNRSFPGSQQGIYESVRPLALLESCRKYDVVLDFHNTYCPGNDCGFIGENADSSLLDVAAYLNLGRVIVADYDCINKYASNCLSVEVSVESDKDDVGYWMKLIKKLALLVTPPARAKDAIDTYRFVYRMTLDDKKRYGLANVNLQAFEPIDTALAQQLGVETPAYPIFIADKFTPYNYGGLLNKTSVRDLRARV